MSGNDTMPGHHGVMREIDYALAVTWGLPHATRDVEPEYAKGVSAMLSYAAGTRADYPVTLVHKKPAA